MGGLLAAVLVAAFVAVPGAAADVFRYIPVTLYVSNNTNNLVRLAPVGSSGCWYNGRLDNDAYTVMDPHHSTGIQTAAIINPALSADCVKAFAYGDNSWRWLEVQNRMPGGTWYDAIGASDANPLGPPTHFELNWPGQDWLRLNSDSHPHFVLRGMFQRWVPVNPKQVGRGGPGGGICIAKNITPRDGNSNNVSVTFRVSNELATDCTSQPESVDIGASGNGRTQAPKAAGPGAAEGMRDRAVATPAATEALPGVNRPRVRLRGSDSGFIADLLQVVGTACDWTQPAPNWPDRSCQQIRMVDKWKLDNLRMSVADLTPQGPTTPIIGRSLIGSLVKDNATRAKGELAWAETVKEGFEHEIETKEGFTWGFGFEGKLGKEHVASLGGDIHFEWDTEHTEATKTVQEQEREAEFRQETEPGTSTYMYIFQTTADMNFNFDAHLTAGKADEAAAVVTPLGRTLGVTPARTNPCIGYLVGPGDPQSFLAQGRRLLAQGYSAQDPTLSSARKTLLRALPGFRSKAGDKCPGFPDGYPAGFMFKGTAGVQLKAAAPAPKALWAGQSATNQIRVCTFATPIGAEKPKESEGSGNPCFGVSKGVNSSPPRGTVGRGDGLVQGDRGSNLLIAQAGGKPDRLEGGAGAFDILMGAGGQQTLLGGPGEDYIAGRAGNDTLVGGSGPDTLAGGPGNDILRDAQGQNRLDGGPGNDRLWTSYRGRGGLLGGPGNDVLTLRGNGRVALDGGSGDDTYRFVGPSAVMRAVELPGDGVDTVEAGHSFKLPPNVEIGKAWGTARGISIGGRDGSQKLVGGPGNDRLDGGTGGDILVGGGGKDALLIGNQGADIVTGGAGADTFIPIGIPAKPPATDQGFTPDSRVTANLITDFRPQQGDQLVLRVTTFGGFLLQLEDHMLVREGANPEPTGTAPQLLFARAGSLLRFDPDGTGPRVAYAVAILRGLKHAPVRAIRIQPQR